MKFIKIYLVVVTTLLLIAVGLGVYVWYTLQTLDAGVREVRVTKSEITGTKVSNSETSDETVQVLTEPIVVKTSSLPESQQKVLNGIGYTAETFTITPSMASCAEKAVGKERLDAILGGGAPSPLESVKLLPCLKP
jgi:hypothetical protein